MAETNLNEVAEGAKKEITLKFAKGLVGKEFRSKSGIDCTEIRIPNQDAEDKRPWQSFVIRTANLHESQDGKSVRINLPAEGNTTLQRSVVVGEKPDGTREWETEKTTVTNAELKKLFEAYKEAYKENTRESALKNQEITLKFGKGLVKDFQGKDGMDYKEIRIPNQDPEDKRPWQTFVVKANHVHENQYGKGMWMKVPAEGSTTLQRSVVVGEKPDGTKEWGTEKTTITNRDLKKLVDAYKEQSRESVTEKLAEKKSEATSQIANAEPREKERSRENALG